MRAVDLTVIATEATALRQQKPELRAGQAHWIALELHRPLIAHKHHGTPADCFNDDTRIPDFWAALTKENE